MKRARAEPKTLDALEAELKEKEDAVAALKKDLGALRRRVTAARKLVAIDDDLKGVLSEQHAKLYLNRGAADRTRIRASALALENAAPGLVRYAIGMRMEQGIVTWEFRKWADYYTYVTPGAPASMYGVKDKEYENWHYAGDWMRDAPSTHALMEQNTEEVKELIKTGKRAGW